MKEQYLKIVRAAKVIDSATFSPKIGCYLEIGLEPLIDANILYKDNVIEKEFFNDFFAQLSVALEKSVALPSVMYLVPEALYEKRSDFGGDKIEIPQDWIFMNQALSPVIMVGGRNVEMQTFKTDITITSFEDLLLNPEKLKALVEEVQHRLSNNDGRFFYYAMIQRNINRTTLMPEYTVMGAGK